MDLKYKVLSKEVVFSLEHYLYECIVCGKKHDRINDCSFRTPTCSKTCSLKYREIPSLYKDHLKAFYNGLIDLMRHYTNKYNWRLPDEDIDVFPLDEMYYILFNNFSICKKYGGGINIYTDSILPPYKYNERRCELVSQYEYNEWIKFLDKDNYYIHKGNEYWTETLSVDCTYSDYYKPIDIIKKIKEILEERELSLKLKNQINKTIIKQLGFCKPIKYKITKLKPIKL